MLRIPCINCTDGELTGIPTIDTQEQKTSKYKHTKPFFNQHPLNFVKFLSHTGFWGLFVVMGRLPSERQRRLHRDNMGLYCTKWFMCCRCSRSCVFYTMNEGGRFSRQRTSTSFIKSNKIDTNLLQIVVGCRCGESWPLVVVCGRFESKMGQRKIAMYQGMVR